MRTGRDGGRSARGNEGSPDEPRGEDVVMRRHPDWVDNQIMWRRLMDSHEGGDRYRNGIYGYDRFGLPCRMLFRHEREYPDSQRNPNYYNSGFPGPESLLTAEMNAMTSMMGPYPGTIAADPAATAQDDLYEMRRSRTPVPEWVSEACDTHLAKVYDQEVYRDPDACPPDLVAWWKDVDGCGTTIDDYMRETIAPLLLALGTIDVLIDHPPAPPGVPIKSRRDELDNGLEVVVASYILPMNTVWWASDHAGRFNECLVREYVDPSERMDHDSKGNAIDVDSNSPKAKKWRQSYVRWRLWRNDQSILYNYDGTEVFERKPHFYGRVPIIRLKDLNNPRTKMVGKSRYLAVAGLQRAFYNLDSELILSDTFQATPLLCMPEDLLKGDNTVSIGVNYVLPMKKNQETGGYQAPEYVSPPTDPSDALRKDKEDFRAAADRAACLSKPAGAETPGTVGQSGLSKQMDSTTGHKLLTSIAKSLAKAETFIAELALVVTWGRDLEPAETESIVIGYPSKFDCMDATQLILNTVQLQLVMASAGAAPMLEAMLISAAAKQLLLGLDDDEYQALDDEIEAMVAAKSTLKEQVHELKGAMIKDASSQRGKGGSNEDDPSGESAGTALGNTIAAVS
jgi:hypothetical protein